MKSLLTLFLTLFISISSSADGRFINYQVNGLEYEGYYVSPSADAPLVLLLHDWDGLTEYEVQRSDMLAAMGYQVFAADLFGAGIRPTKVEDKRQHTGELYKDREKLRNLMLGAIKTARSEGANATNTVAMGYCFGGAAVLELARAGAQLKGFATFHGGLSIPQGQDYSRTSGELLIMHGSADTAIPLTQFATLAAELEKSNINHEMITYSGAPHAFTVFDSQNYHEESDRKSWQRFSDFLKRVTRQ